MLQDKAVSAMKGKPRKSFTVAITDGILLANCQILTLVACRLLPKFIPGVVYEYMYKECAGLLWMHILRGLHPPPPWVDVGLDI